MWTSEWTFRFHKIGGGGISWAAEELISFSAITLVGRDNLVGMATRYGLDGPEIESRWGANFRTRPDRPWGPTSLLCNGYRVSFPGVKRPGRGVNHPPHLAPKLKEYNYTSTLLLSLLGVF